MNTTQALNNGRHSSSGQAQLGFTGKLRAIFRDQQQAQQLLVEMQAPWMNRH